MGCPLGIWIAVFLVNSGVGSVRRSVDQRIYLDMFTEMRVAFFLQPRCKKAGSA